MRKRYRCELTPLGEYFMGGERTFTYREGGQNNNYFIQSEETISQATLLGMLRFYLLKQANLLSVDRSDEILSKKVQELIGPNGFCPTGFESERIQSFGGVKEISPLVIKRENGYLVRTPLNHNVKNTKSYEPYVMKSVGYTEMGADTIVPQNFQAKEGLFFGWYDMESKEIVPTDQLFDSQVRTRVSKTQRQDGFFKKEYQFLKPECKFVFWTELELPDDFTLNNEIVFMGQEKSAFSLQLVEDADGSENLTIEMSNRFNQETSEKYCIYFASSDTYIEDYEAVQKTLIYSMIEKRNYRFLNRRGRDKFGKKNDYSKLYEFVQAGSVFYVKRESEQQFLEQVNLQNLQQIGFNKVIKIGE